MSSHDAMECIKDMAHEAAARSKHRLRRTGATSLEEKAYWCTKWLRAGRANYERVQRQCEEALVDIIAAGGSDAGVPKLLRGYMNEILTRDLEAALTEPGLSQGERVKKHSEVDRRLALWRQSRKVASLSCVLEDDGGPAPSLHRSAKILHSHWEGVFTAKLVDASAIQQLLPHVQRWHREDHNPPNPDEFKTMVMNTGNTALGPDGVPHAFWRSLYDHVGGHIHKHLCELWQGGSCPLGFNDSYMVFLPKVETTSGGVRPEETRPLNLNNTDNKLLAKMANCLLAQAAEATVHQQPTGLIRGRNGGEGGEHPHG